MESFSIEKLPNCDSEYLYHFSEKAMAPHSSTLAWKIPWMEKPGRLHAGHEVAKSQTWLSDLTFTFHFPALEKEMATHSSSCLENPRDGGAWWAAVYAVAQSRTQLKWLSSSSSIPFLYPQQYEWPSFSITVPAFAIVTISF